MNIEITQINIHIVSLNLNNDHPPACKIKKICDRLNLVCPAQSVGDPVTIVPIVMVSTPWCIDNDGDLSLALLCIHTNRDAPLYS